MGRVAFVRSGRPTARHGGAVSGPCRVSVAVRLHSATRRSRPRAAWRAGSTSTTSANWSPGRPTGYVALSGLVRSHSRHGSARSATPTPDHSPSQRRIPSLSHERRPTDRRVSARASRQHGLIRTDQVPSSQQDRLRHLARRGIIRRVAKGVYGVSGAPHSWHQDLQAGVWSLGPTSVVSHRAAARLHGFDAFDLEAVEFTIGRACRGRRPAGIPCTVHTTKRSTSG